MKEETYYCLVLSQSQMQYLAGSKYGIDRMKALASLIELAATSDAEYQKKGFSSAIRIGQIIISEVELSHLWKCDRKTVSKILDRMNQVGLLASVQTNRTSIHTLLCVSAWYLDGRQINNPFYVPMKKRHECDTRQIGKNTRYSSGDTNTLSAVTPSGGNVRSNTLKEGVAHAPLNNSVTSLSSKDCCSVKVDASDTSEIVASRERNEGKECNIDNGHNEASNLYGISDKATFKALDEELAERMLTEEHEKALQQEADIGRSTTSESDNQTNPQMTK